MAMAPQNILLIHSDQHRFDCVGVNDRSRIRTPNLDRLARQGVNFTSAFTPIPLCVPARNCLLHGRWPVQHLCIANWDTEAPRPPPEGLPTFIEPLKLAGYRLGYVGKWHVNREKGPLEYGFDEYVPDSQYHRWREAMGLKPVPRTNGWFGEVDPYITPDQSRLAWGADRVIEMIERAVEADRPFFVRWDPSEPHLPNVVPEPYCSMYEPDKVEPWPSFPDPLSGKPFIQRQQRRTWKIDGWGWEKWAPIVARYLGEVSLMDAQIGRILASLSQLGIEKDTLVVYTTDHGDMCGGHGMIDKHFVMYEDVVHVPLILRWPKEIPAGSVCDSFVISEIDLATTICRAAGAEVPPTFVGRDLVGLARGGGDERANVYSTYHGNQFGLYSQRMVRDRRFKYVWNATDVDELYDLQADPGELNNLALDREYRDRLQEMRRRLLEWMEGTADPLANPWIIAQLLEGLK